MGGESDGNGWKWLQMGVFVAKRTKKLARETHIIEIRKRCHSEEP